MPAASPTASPCSSFRAAPMCAWSSTRKASNPPSGSRSAASTARCCAIALPADGWAAGPDAPVHDAMRALRLLRSRPGATPAAGRRFGIIGFSAGGHLTARLITEPALAYPPQDDADALSARPDFAVLMYPVIAMNGTRVHSGSAKQLLAAGVAAGELERYSPNLHVGAHTPPTLLVHAADDDSVPVENSLLMFAALRSRRRAQRTACVRPRRAWVRNARRGWHRCSSVAAAGRELGAGQCKTVAPLSAGETC